MTLRRLAIFAATIILLFTACSTADSPEPSGTPLLESAATTGEDAPTQTPAAITSAGSSTGSPESAADERRVLVVDVSGTVRIMETPDSELRDLEVDEVLTPPARLVASRNSYAVLQLDDGTVVVISAETTVELATLEGTTGKPVTQFFLNLGQVFAFRLGLDPLPDDAAFEVETMNGVMAIRGSSMSVKYGSDGSWKTTLVCLEGSCEARNEAQDVQPLSIGQRVEVQDDVIGQVEDATAADIQEGNDTLDRVKEAGLLQDTETAEVLPTAVPTAVVTPTKTPTPVPTESFVPVVQSPGTPRTVFSQQNCRGGETTLFFSSFEDGRLAALPAGWPIESFEGSGAVRAENNGLFALAPRPQSISQPSRLVSDIYLFGSGQRYGHILGPYEGHINLSFGLGMWHRDDRIGNDVAFLNTGQWYTIEIDYNSSLPALLLNGTVVQTDPDWTSRVFQSAGPGIAIDGPSVGMYFDNVLLCQG